MLRVRLHRTTVKAFQSIYTPLKLRPLHSERAFRFHPLCLTNPARNAYTYPTNFDRKWRNRHWRIT